MGSNTGMVFTNNCTGYVAGVFNGSPTKAGVSTDGGGKCIANPQYTWNGTTGSQDNSSQFITFETSGDDSNINDVLYWSPLGSVPATPAYNQFWALTNGLNSGSYNLLQNKNCRRYHLGFGRFFRVGLFWSFWFDRCWLCSVEPACYTAGVPTQRLGLLRRRHRSRRTQ